MADTNETIADIIAEMRNRAKRPDFVSQDVLKSCADRLEAAHRREAAFHAMTCEANERLREHLRIALDADKRERGDCAKLREALKHIKDRLPHMLQYMRVHWEDASAGGYFDELMLVIDAALAEPPRNCDRFGGDIDKLREACARERGLNPEEDFPDVFPDWLLSTATKKEGGNDGNE